MEYLDGGGQLIEPNAKLLHLAAALKLVAGAEQRQVLLEPRVHIPGHRLGLAGVLCGDHGNPRLAFRLQAVQAVGYQTRMAADILEKIAIRLASLQPLCVRCSHPAIGQTGT